MSTIILRNVKGSPLTNTEVDTNFTNLNTDKLEKIGAPSLYLGSSANSTRFPNAIGVSSNTLAGIQQNESHNIGIVAEGTGSLITTTATGTLSAFTIVVGSATGILLGQIVSGTGIATNAIVTIIAGTTITLSIANTGTVSGTVSFISMGAGLYGVGYTSGLARSGGVVGEGHVSASSDTGSAIGIRGYSTDTHVGGLNIGLYSDAVGGSFNYALYMNSGNILSNIAQTWTLGGNLTFSGAYSVTVPTLSLTNALSIGNGGTGATSAASALTALGAASLGANTFTNAQTLGNNNLVTIKTATFNGQGAQVTTTGTLAIDWSAAQNYLQTEPTGPITYTFTAPPGPCHLQLIIDSDGTSTAQVITWPVTVIQYGLGWSGVANKRSIINFWYDGTSYHMTGMNQV